MVYFRLFSIDRRICSSTTTFSISATNMAGSTVRQKFLLFFWEGEMSHVLERRRSHSPAEARCAVVQQPGHACSWRSKAGLVYFWHCAFSHKSNAFKKNIHSSLSLFVCFIFPYSFSLSSIFFFYSSYLIIFSCSWILLPLFIPSFFLRLHRRMFGY